MSPEPGPPEGAPAPTPPERADAGADADADAGAGLPEDGHDGAAGFWADPDHDEAGLDLARTIARSIAGAARTAPRKRRPRRSPDAARKAAASSGAHPDDRDPQLLDVTLGRLVADQGWSLDLRVHSLFGRWPEIVGAEVAAHCTPTSFADGKVVVRTDSTAWATQLRLLAPTVVRRLNEELGHGSVTVIHVEGPTAPSWKKGRLGVRDGRGPRDTYG